MGTSSSYKGPTGSGSLLPPWAPPPGGGDDEHGPSIDPSEEPSDGVPAGHEQAGDGETIGAAPRWAAPKSSLSRYATSIASGGDGRPGYLRAAGSGFVRTQGGSRAAAHAATAGRASAQRLGGFLSHVAREGVAAAAQSLGLQQFVGRDADSLLAALVDTIAPAGAILEEAAAREAAIVTLESLFEDIGAADAGIEELGTLDADGVLRALHTYISNYIYTRLIQTLSANLEGRSTGDLVAVEQDLREYVFSTVRLDLGHATDALAIRWRESEGRDFVERIYEDAFELIGNEA